MKPNLSALLLAGFLVLSAAAQDASSGTAPTTTASMSNGRRWRALGEGEKIVWIIAYRDGLMEGFLSKCAKTDDCKHDSLVKFMEDLYPDKLTYGEARAALDHFFETPENRPITIGDGLGVVVMSAFGVKQSIIDDYVSGLRRVANRDSSK